MRRRRFGEPPAVRVDTAWYRWWEVRPATFWLEVGKRVKSRRIKRRDEKAVRAVCREVEYMRDWKVKGRT